MESFEAARALSPYGTPDMAYEIMRLFEVSDVPSRRILVMAGHEGGIVIFGKNLREAFDVLIRARELQRSDAGRQYAGQSGQNARGPQPRAK